MRIETNLFGQKKAVWDKLTGKQSEMFDKEDFRCPDPDVEGQMLIDILLSDPRATNRLLEDIKEA